MSLPLAKRRTPGLALGYIHTRVTIGRTEWAVQGSLFIAEHGYIRMAASIYSRSQPERPAARDF
jgi:hypothetical protein